MCWDLLQCVLYQWNKNLCPRARNIDRLVLADWAQGSNETTGVLPSTLECGALQSYFHLLETLCLQLPLQRRWLEETANFICSTSFSLGARTNSVIPVILTCFSAGTAEHWNTGRFSFKYGLRQGAEVGDIAGAQPTTQRQVLKPFCVQGSKNVLWACARKLCWWLSLKHPCVQWLYGKGNSFEKTSLFSPAIVFSICSVSFTGLGRWLCLVLAFQYWAWFVCLFIK